MKTGLADRIMSHGRNSLAENIALCIAAALAGTFYSYEYYYDTQLALHTPFCLVLTAIIAVTWLMCAFRCGRDAKYGFPIFAFIYWAVPYAYLLWYASRDNVRGYSKWLTMIKEIAEALCRAPFSETAQKTGAPPTTLAAMLLMTVMAVYAAGLFAGRAFDKKLSAPADDNDEKIPKGS